MVKLRATPRENWHVTAYDYRHDLNAPQFLRAPVRSTRRADEVNLPLEYIAGEHVFC